MVENSRIIKLAKNWRKRVRDIYRDSPDLNAREILDCLIAQLGQSEKAPGLNSVQKYLQKYVKPIVEKIKEERLDIPWTITGIKRLNLPAECTMPIIIVQKWAEAQQVKVAKQKPRNDWESWVKDETKFTPITLRQAIWISRLYTLAREKDGKVNGNWLWHWSRVYTMAEIQSKLNEEKEFDSSILDAALLDPETKISFIFNDYHIVTKDGNYTGTTDCKSIKELKDGESDGKRQY